MSDPFYGVIERDLAEKCSVDTAAVLRRAFQLCDTQRSAVVIGVAGVAGAVAALAGAFYATYDGDLTEDAIDAFWRDAMRPVVLAALGQVGGPLTELRASVARKPKQ